MVFAEIIEIVVVRVDEEIDECNRKGNRRKRAKVGAGKTRKGESDVDREMKGD